MTTIKRRTGGRSGLVIAAVRRAVEELLESSGPESLSIPKIAERAGVHPASVYRRWQTTSELLDDVVRYRLNPDRPLPRTGDVRADITSWAVELVEHFGTPSNVLLLRAGAALAGDADKDCTAQWRREANVLLEQADPQGATLSIDDLIHHVMAPIVFEAIFGPEPLRRSQAEALVADAFRISGGGST